MDKIFVVKCMEKGKPNTEIHAYFRNKPKNSDIEWLILDELLDSKMEVIKFRYYDFLSFYEQQVKQEDLFNRKNEIIVNYFTPNGTKRHIWVVLEVFEHIIIKN